jgi:hypothetical protein
MGLQPGEIIVGDWTVWDRAPRSNDYVDRQSYNANGYYESVITNIPSGGNPLIGRSYSEMAAPFTLPYDRFEVIEATFIRREQWYYFVTYANGNIATDWIDLYTYSFSPDDSPTYLPQPTLQPANNLPPTISSDINTGSPAISISWYPKPTGTFVDTELLVDFIPITRLNQSTDINRPYQTLRPLLFPGGLPPRYGDIVLWLPTKLRFYKKADKPTYIDLLSGYTLDLRSVIDEPEITLPSDLTVDIGYYRENKLEPIPNLRSIDWLTYQCKFEANQPYILPIVDCVLGTLVVSDSSVVTAIMSLPTIAGKYPHKYYFQSFIPDLFAVWYALWNPTGVIPSLDLNGSGVLEQRILRVIGGNNDAWLNRPIGTADLNPDPAHPMLVIDNTRGYDWHLSPQLEGIGILVMDSTRTIEMHLWLQKLNKALQVDNYQVEDLTTNPELHYLDWYIKNSSQNSHKVYNALDAGTWGVNPADPNLPRIDNLGWRIQRGNELLGLRVKVDGTIDLDLEKTVNRRLHAEGSTDNDIQEYNPNCFGSKGMLIRVLPNKFSTSGTVAGGYRKIKDIPQLLAELHEQANAAMGYQEGTAIEIQLDGQTYRYPNQLALLTELFVTAKQTATYSKGAFFSSIIGEQSIKEVIAGLGLRTVDKYLEFKIAGKAVKLYYKGISASQSIRRKLSAVATNVGMVLGNII